VARVPCQLDHADEQRSVASLSMRYFVLFLFNPCLDMYILLLENPVGPNVEAKLVYVPFGGLASSFFFLSSFIF